MIPTQQKPALTGDYSRDIATLRLFLDRIPTFPTHLVPFTPSGSVGGGVGDYAIPGPAITHKKQEGWTDLVIDIRGSAYATAVTAIVAWLPILRSSATTPVVYTQAVGYHFFNVANQHQQIPRAGVFRGLPAGLYTFSPAFRVGSGSVTVDTNDRFEFIFQEAIPYGLDGTT
jgi:hypothetical protein